MKCKVITRLIPTIASLLVLSACSIAPKNEISSSANPQEEIRRLSTDIDRAEEVDIDILARKDFIKSHSHLEQAKQALIKSQKQEVVLDHLRYGRESLNHAYMTARDRKDTAPALLEARKSAIASGASRSHLLKSEWMQLDEDVADNAYRMQQLSPRKLEEYQNRYINLQKKAIIHTYLGSAMAQIKGAQNDGAKNRAPRALRNAEISLKNAESLIGSNMNNQSRFSLAVAAANNDANYLSDVMKTIDQSNPIMSETSASKLVLQKRQIAVLKKDIKSQQETISDAQSEMEEKNISITNTENDLKNAQSSITTQTMLESSRKKFTNDEAEAYQQGENLLIRLKSMNFKSGQSDLPSSSLTLLSKVAEIAKSLNAKEIKIEGHTDSIGQRAINKRLSEQRAIAVAAYFNANGLENTLVTSEGLGFEKPIATNKSKAGRAQNRRVDIVITPADLSMAR